jgi:ubiquinone/menaquinone biosynthesis C-methylase UbiE
LALAVVAFTGAAAAIALAAHFGFFMMPVAWTGEPVRLVNLLGIGPGDRVADIGAGNGAHAVALARLVGPDGEVLATDIDANRRGVIAKRAAAAGVNIRVIEASAEATNLADRCCDAIYMRTMFHHVQDRLAFAKDVVRSVRPGGRIAVIDFSPGRLWFHGRDHGVTPELVLSAFANAGCSLRHRDDSWGGPTFLLLFDCGGGSP